MAKVLLLGPLADVLDTGSVDIELGEQIQTIQPLFAKLSEQGPEWQNTWTQQNYRSRLTTNLRMHSPK